MCCRREERPRPLPDAIVPWAMVCYLIPFLTSERPFLTCCFFLLLTMEIWRARNCWRVRKDRDLDLGDATDAEGGISLWHVRARVYCESLEEGRKKKRIMIPHGGKGLVAMAREHGEWRRWWVIRLGGSSRKR